MGIPAFQQKGAKIIYRRFTFYCFALFLRDGLHHACTLTHSLKLTHTRIGDPAFLAFIHFAGASGGWTGREGISGLEVMMCINNLLICCGRSIAKRQTGSDLDGWGWKGYKRAKFMIPQFAF